MPKPKSLKLRKLPQQSRSRKTVKRILRSAAHILETEGIEGFNTNAIAEAANISIGSLYQYFPDKDTMTAMLIHQHTAAFLSQLKIEIDQTQSFDINLKKLIQVAVAQQLQRPKLFQLLDVEEARLPLDYETQVAQSEILKLIADLLRQQGYQKIAVAAQDVLAIARGMIDTAGAAGEQDLSDLETRVFRAVVGYLQSHPQLS